MPIFPAPAKIWRVTRNGSIPATIRSHAISRLISYGCHDNYLMRRDIAWDRIVAGMLPFLVTRQIFAGAGKMGIEAESAQGEPGVYQISQRADFFSVVVSIDT